MRANSIVVNSPGFGRAQAAASRRGSDNPVRAVDAFVEELDLKSMGFEGADPAVTGRPSYQPAVLLKIYIYGYLNRIAWSGGWSGRPSATSS